MKVKNYLWRTTPEGNIGYFILRAFVGVAMLTHGWPKLIAGPERWEQLGGVMGSIGIPGPAVFWGFMAAFAESIGAIMLAIGLLTPVAALLILITMAVAVFVVHGSDPFSVRELGLMFLFTSLLFMLKGAGNYSIDHFLSRFRK